MFCGTPVKNNYISISIFFQAFNAGSKNFRGFFCVVQNDRPVTDSISKLNDRIKGNSFLFPIPKSPDYKGISVLDFPIGFYFKRLRTYLVMKKVTLFLHKNTNYTSHLREVTSFKYTFFVLQSHFCFCFTLEVEDVLFFLMPSCLHKFQKK